MEQIVREKFIEYSRFTLIRLDEYCVGTALYGLALVLNFLFRKSFNSQVQYRSVVSSSSIFVKHIFDIEWPSEIREETDPGEMVPARWIGRMEMLIGLFTVVFWWIVIDATRQFVLASRHVGFEGLAILGVVFLLFASVATATSLLRVFSVRINVDLR